ncbi:MAG: His/Gly/Thr/Pro-type tRNA ligase C-terminal domain-containing protein, partial [Flavobacteriales bacterium]
TDFDLKQHQEFSGKKLQYFDHELNESYTPYVVETSIGLDRMFLAIFSNSLCEETLENNTTRTVLKIPPFLSPYKVAVLPLVKKDGLSELAKDIYNNLKLDFNVTYDEKDAVGRRYRRQDAIGTPYCITVDHQTKEDSTITIRDRDSMSQERISCSEITRYIKEKVSFNTALSTML